MRPAVVWLAVVARAALAQQPASEVTLTVHSFPAGQVYQETAADPTYLGRTGQPLQLAPPTLRDRAGRATQYLNGTLIVKAEGHVPYRVNVAAQEWNAGRLPAEGRYRLVPATLWVAAGDWISAYPWPATFLLAGLGGGLGAAWRWRRAAASTAQANAELADRLRTTGDPLLGKSLGAYRVVDRLGQGGMGTVYRVADERGQQYAAKVLYCDPGDAQPLARFRREFRLIRELRHPALVRGFDYGEEDGVAWCVMELARGTTLDRYLRPEGLPWATVWPWLRQLLEGLRCAHEHGVVHRDLKPANLMLHAGQLKILDFGLARQADYTAVTQTGQGFGTPRYLAPEQITAAGTDVEPRTDLYSVGVILFELLAGRAPFEAQSSQELLSQHLTQPPPRLTELRPDLPAGLGEVVATLLAKRPESRYPTAARVLEVLEALACSGDGAAQVASAAGDADPTEAL